MRALYSLNIFLYGLAIRIASLFNPKAKLWISGRKNLFSELELKLKNGDGPVAWFHCASLGEFEQGRPLMERFRKAHPQYRILLTFFSPSGYEVRKNYPGADIVCYLPLDTKANARRFVQLVQPKIVFFIKYEFWLNHLVMLAEKNIPHVLVAAIFRENQVFFKGYGGLFRKALKEYSFIFTQENNSLALLKQIGIQNAEQAGDTRFDRVAEIAAGAKEIPVAAAFAKNKPVLVAGSTWPADEEQLFPVLKMHFASGWKLLIAPHELGEAHLASIEEKLAAAGLAKDKILRFSTADETKAAAASVLLIDNIGMLSSLYRYGKVAYIGGGFGKSIHNTLEAAVYGIPVVFGPRFEKFNEAKGLIASGGGFGVQSAGELQHRLYELLLNEQLREEAGMKAGNYVSENTGATEKVLKKAADLI
jgi:3-deoxy-D-manno-octulosonic-acid transferase